MKGIFSTLIKNEFEGEIAGLQVDTTNIPQHLVNFLIEEVGKDLHDAINFIDKTVDQLEEYNKEENAGDHQGDPGQEQSKASKTQGLLPGAPQAHPADGTATTTTMPADGDKKGMQFVSMAPGG